MYTCNFWLLLKVNDFKPVSDIQRVQGCLAYIIKTF